MRDDFEQILKVHGIYGEDPEAILYAVHDMLLLVADETRVKEPYATNSIDRLENAAFEIFYLATDL